MPDSVFVRPTVMVVFDAVKDEMIVVTPVYPQAGIDAKEAYAAAIERLREVVKALDEPLPHATSMSGVELALPTAVSNTTPAEFMGMVERAKEYIAAGDIFQVVLSQRFSAPFHLPPLALYRALRRTNPSPFLFYLDFGAYSLVGSSPEILVRVRDGEVTIRPLAGTRRRGATPDEDKALEAELLADPKERAEHLMLLDLGRNDVGRVAKIGSVRVKESFVIERYSHVMHISSHVTGTLDKKHDVIDALMAGFPAGTLSGAPKVRAMQIIDELEKEKRGPYGGCVGYFSADGEMDSCIVLRTALVKDGKIHVQAGAGVVAELRPQGRAAGVRVQGPGAVQGRRGGRPLRRARQARQPLAARAAARAIARSLTTALASRVMIPKELGRDRHAHAPQSCCWFEWIGHGCRCRERHRRSRAAPSAWWFPRRPAEPSMPLAGSTPNASRTSSARPG